MITNQQDMPLQSSVGTYVRYGLGIETMENDYFHLATQVYSQQLERVLRRQIEANVVKVTLNTRLQPLKHIILNGKLTTCNHSNVLYSMVSSQLATIQIYYTPW